MKSAVKLLLVFVVVLLPCLSWAQAFDTHHRIFLSLGYHSFFPESGEHQGVKPNDDGVVTDDEWTYIFDEGYDISDYNGGTLEIGYEYNFFPWFGLGVDIGGYGGSQSYNFTIEGVKVDTDVAISVFHIDALPRFHWQTRWTDLYGGPVLGLYRGTANSKVDVEVMGVGFSDSDNASDSGVGFGLEMGFELRISKHWGIDLEDRLMHAQIGNDSDRTKWFNAGGNVIVLSCVAHL